MVIFLVRYLIFVFLLLLLSFAGENKKQRQNQRFHPMDLYVCDTNLYEWFRCLIIIPRFFHNDSNVKQKKDEKNEKQNAARTTAQSRINQIVY